jgi:hypothetical protein
MQKACDSAQHRWTPPGTGGGGEHARRRPRAAGAARRRRHGLPLREVWGDAKGQALREPNDTGRWGSQVTHARMHCFQRRRTTGAQPGCPLVPHPIAAALICRRSCSSATRRLDFSQQLAFEARAAFACNIARGEAGMNLAEAALQVAAEDDAIGESLQAALLRISWLRPPLAKALKLPLHC